MPLDEIWKLILRGGELGGGRRSQEMARSLKTMLVSYRTRRKKGR